MSAIPNAYNRQANFTSYEASNPTTPKPGASLDAEFNAVKTAMDTTQSRLSEIQRDDGALRNGIVTVTALDGSVTLLLTTPINPRGAWATATSYAVNDVVTQGSTLYLAIVDHISGTFATDLSVNKWQAISGSLDAGAVVDAHIASVSGAHAATAISVTPAGGISSTNVQAALVELDTEKAPIANPNFTGTASVGGATLATQTFANNAAAAAVIAHEADGAAVHAASAISVAPVGGVASTNVQAAIQELDSEKATRQTGMPLRSSQTSTSAAATGTTPTPLDNTIPQNNEGTEFLVTSFTPSAAGVTLLVEAVLHVSHSTDNTHMIAHLHPNNSVNAAATAVQFSRNQTSLVQINLRHFYVAPDTSNVQFRVRVGSPNVGTVTLNGVSGAGSFGGTLFSSIRVTELAA
jgi:hypothetical protein